VSTPNLAITHLTASQSNKVVTANTAFDDLDGALCGNASQAMPDSDLTLDTTEFLTHMLLIFTGALSADRNVILPAHAKPFIVVNNTTGSPSAFNLTFKVGTGADVVTISDSNPHMLYSDGVNSVYKVS